MTAALAASGVQPRYLPNGTITLTGKVPLGPAGVADNTLADGDTFKLAKIPHGAFILDGWLDIVSTNGSFEINVGTSADEDAIAASVCFSAGILLHFGDANQTGVQALPFKISVTDNVRDQFLYLTATVGSGVQSPSTSGTLIFMVKYTMDLTV